MLSNAEHPLKVFVVADLSTIKADPDCVFDLSYRPTLQAMVDIVMAAEAPVREDVLAQRVARAHGWLRTGARIRDQITHHLKELEGTGRNWKELDRTEEASGTFLWKPGTVSSRVPFRKPQGLRHRRNHGGIAVAELTDFVLSNPIVLDEDDPPLKYARLLQVERLTAPSRERLQEAMRGHEHLEHMSRASEN